MEEHIPSSSRTEPWSQNLDCGEMRDLITIWGKKETQHQLHKRHHNRDVFKHISPADASERPQQELGAVPDQNQKDKDPAHAHTWHQ